MVPVNQQEALEQVATFREETSYYFRMRGFLDFQEELDNYFDTPGLVHFPPEISQYFKSIEWANDTAAIRDFFDDPRCERRLDAEEFQKFWASLSLAEKMFYKMVDLRG